MTVDAQACSQRDRGSERWPQGDRFKTCRHQNQLSDSTRITRHLMPHARFWREKPGDGPKSVRLEAGKDRRSGLPALSATASTHRCSLVWPSSYDLQGIHPTGRADAPTRTLFELERTRRPKRPPGSSERKLRAPRATKVGAVTGENVRTRKSRNLSNKNSIYQRDLVFGGKLVFRHPLRRCESAFGSAGIGRSGSLAPRRGLGRLPLMNMGRSPLKLTSSAVRHFPRFQALHLEHRVRCATSRCPSQSLRGPRSLG